MSCDQAFGSCDPVVASCDEVCHEVGESYVGAVASHSVGAVASAFCLD